VPSSWRTRNFDGISFSVPGAWHVLHTPYVPGFFPGFCSSEPAFIDERVVLSTDEKEAVFSCPAQHVIKLAVSGLQLDEGQQQRPVSVASTGCLNLSGLRACPVTGPTYTLLVYRVTVPGRTKPVIVTISLAGNGMVARTILYSSRPA
jgi:hypothetical protein